MPLAFIGGTELIWVLIIGLLLFGGKLPDVAKGMGRTFFKAKRSIDEIRRDSGIDDAIRDLERETRDLNRSAHDLAAEAKAAAQDVPDWRQNLDPATGPDSEEVEAEAEALKNDGPNSDLELPEADEPPLKDRREDSQQSDLEQE
ncbi:MAG: twin-arginine translocase TatA/TatE family subunit [Planctomycetes bacterium]|nr:twin-arginine translocase TatA/TatE family subunit [Planctomycetota bacterium]